MPTIHPRSHLQMVGTLSLCPPYGICDLVCDCPTGKSVLIFRNGVKPETSENQKYIASVFPQISGITALVSPRDEGRWPSSLTRGEMRWTPMP